MDLIKAVETSQIKDEPNINVGDLVQVHFKIVEGKTERVQIYEGTLIACNNSGLRKTITVRKISNGVGVERIFPLHSPRIEKVEVVRAGKVRRSKLYYLRDRVGKASKVKELLKKKTADA
jgi:large subunit ribosomal protein L19